MTQIWPPRNGAAKSLSQSVLSEEFDLESERRAQWRLGEAKRDPFSCFKTRPEIIRLAVTSCVRFLQSVLSEETDLLEFPRGISVAVGATCLVKAKQMTKFVLPLGDADMEQSPPNFPLTMP